MADLETTVAPETNGKATKTKLPKVEQVFDTEDAASAGQQAAQAVGYKKAAVRRFKITSQDGKVTKFALGYGAANAAAKVVTAMGVKIEALDRSTRTPQQDTAASILAGFSKLSDAERALVMAELNKKPGRK